MRKFVTLNCLVDWVDTEPFPSDDVQNLRQAVLAPVIYKPILLQALKNVNFKFHRTSSYQNIIRECNVGEGETLLMFWGCERTYSKVTMSMSVSSSSSTAMLVS
ncbi:Midasin [Operophtera brumata]|uniref:Midasin n=1 Tax=Operophtera brumata TaxID=104452 RepID=A0A0L7LGM5_OPEBR|nr:Midasin [Operophtera brumata]